MRCERQHDLVGRTLPDAAFALLTATGRTRQERPALEHFKLAVRCDLQHDLVGRTLPDAAFALLQRLVALGKLGKSDPLKTRATSSRTV